MGELLPGNFNSKSSKDRPLSPFKKSELARAKFGEPIFSKNGVVEYTKGSKPKDEAEVLDKVLLHVNPMERTILSVFPNLKISDVPPEMQEVLSTASGLSLVEYIADSDQQDWTMDEEQALGYLGIINEVRARDLDLEED